MNNLPTNIDVVAYYAYYKNFIFKEWERDRDGLQNQAPEMLD